VEIVGPDVLLDGLQHLHFPLKPANLARWLLNGAGTLPSERIRWLRAAYPHISSAAD